jgi:DNA invertase Pin-like site-specific DNA recombinase
MNIIDVYEDNGKTLSELLEEYIMVKLQSVLIIKSMGELMYNTLLQNNSLFKLGSYLRLSKEDENKPYRRENESESITNQRSLIMNYIKDNGFTFVKEYVDDGYSGTTFEDRPAFQEMLNDIEKGKINAVITKDLSRLGRDYIQSGYYLEQYFPSKKVRYISILDNIDTFLDNANNDIAPFKSLFNDMTSKDTSKKIRSILRDKKRQGLFLGSEASYGYMKDPNDKHHLILNPKTAPIVRRIFDMPYLAKVLLILRQFLVMIKLKHLMHIRNENLHING